MKWKIRTYAIYQILSLSTIIFLMASVITLTIQESKFTGTMSWDFWKEKARIIFTFNYETDKFAIAGFFAYLSVISILFSWFVGWLIYSYEDRNYYDALFLMFLVFPIVSNIFALLGQLSLKSDFSLKHSLTKEDLNTAVKNLQTKMGK